jgi:hypothetical protein
MLKTLRESSFTNVFWSVFSLYLFNLSADNPDANSRHHMEDLSINDQESIVELIVEQVMGFGDAFEEYEDPDGDDQKSKISFKIDFFTEKISNLDSKQIRIITKNYRSADLQAHILKGFGQLSTPPPKA